MSIASKLFGMWAVGKTASASAPVFMRFLAGMAAVAFCAIIAAAIIVMLIVGAAWLAYGQLTAYGIDSQTSALMIAAFLLVLLVLIMLVAKNYCHEVQENCKKMLHLQSPLGGRVFRVFDAFIDGFNGTKPPQ